MNERVLHTPRERLSETGSEETSRPEPHMSAGTPVYCWVEVLQRGEKGEGGGIESMYLMGVVLDIKIERKTKHYVGIIILTKFTKYQMYPHARYGSLH